MLFFFFSCVMVCTTVLGVRQKSARVSSWRSSPNVPRHNRFGTACGDGQMTDAVNDSTEQETKAALVSRAKHTHTHTHTHTHIRWIRDACEIQGEYTPRSRLGSTRGSCTSSACTIPGCGRYGPSSARASL